MLPVHRRIFLCEGETDAITVISTGVERPGESLVLALVSATVYPNPEPFRGKEIVLVPDLDHAGERCAQALAKRLSPHAKSIEYVDLREVTGA